MNEVIYLSDRAPVHMADAWFDIATVDDFWVKRRFDVMCKLAKDINFRGKKIGEIGCGHGLIQKQFETRLGVAVDGFELNELALRKSIATGVPRYYYNIFDRAPQFQGGYDTLVLFDVLEHIEQEKPFLEAVLFHLKPGGNLIINVPAFMCLHSRYDQVMGHHRRYRFAMLEQACATVGLSCLRRTYWGMPFVPLLLLRRMMLAPLTDPREVTQRGFKPPGRLINRLLTAWGMLETIPQGLIGTSVMAIYRK